MFVLSKRADTFPLFLPFCQHCSGTLQVHSEPDLGLVEPEIKLFILLTSLLEQFPGPSHHAATQTEVLTQVSWAKQSSPNHTGSHSTDLCHIKLIISLYHTNIFTQYFGRFFSQ